MLKWVIEYLRGFAQDLFAVVSAGSLVWLRGSAQFLPQELLSLPLLQVSVKSMANLHWSLSSSMRSKNEPCTSQLEI